MGVVCGQSQQMKNISGVATVTSVGQLSVDLSSLGRFFSSSNYAMDDAVCDKRKGGVMAKCTYHRIISLVREHALYRRTASARCSYGTTFLSGESCNGSLKTLCDKESEKATSAISPWKK